MSRYRCPLGRMTPTKPDPEQVKREGWQNQRILVVSPDDHRIDFVERQLLEQIGERYMGKSAVVEVQMEEALFSSAHAALVFAFNFSGQSYDRPMMNRLGAPAVGSGKGLVGLDGAAQAGMIRAEVKGLGKLAEAIITARLAPRMINCECCSACCSGHKPNRVWTDAIAVLSDHVRTTALAGCTANGLLRREYVVRYFTRKEERIGIEALADKYEIDRHTVSAHAGKVTTLFGGMPARKERVAVPGLEDIAMEAIENRLREVCMVGT